MGITWVRGISMNKETHRYIFLVRQQFGKDPALDSFYKLVSPSGMTGDEIKMMTILKEDWEKESLKADTSAFSGMDLRLRFNSDMFQKVCMVKSTVDLSYDDIDMYIKSKHITGELMEFLEESAI